ncbi:glycosyltransferase [Luteibacter aegosomatis]|uniref:glycosyltransferase n=1 Tax=Luteibacter aegosomatis TaxID=2911537 RepID=UPI001FF9BCF9|nr:glycosyltransferase [Luteibacter aegosomatis]UPG87728.1 glycosyltransferase [Luteibacter aegosomatis]
MNITHFVENLNRGGLERMVLDLVKTQHAQGDAVQVVCLYERGTLASELDALGIPVHACGKRDGLDLRALGRARAHLLDHRTEVLHTHNAVAHYQAVLASAGMGIRQVVNTRHGMGAARRPGRREWLFRRAMRATDAVVAVCEAAREDAIRRGIAPANKTCVVPNGIALDHFELASDTMHERLARMINVPVGTRILGTVGRLNWAKDHASLIRAFRIVRRNHHDTALVIVGDGELRDTLRACAFDEGVAGSVHFLGDRNDVRELLQGMDLFVLSSVTEGYSMALLEACATGLPIVATDVGGNAEIVRDRRTGRIVPPSDPTLLAEAMLDMLHGSQQASGLGRAARAWVETHGSLDVMAARYGQLYFGGVETSP